MTNEERAKEIMKICGHHMESPVFEAILKHLTEACETAYHEGYDEGGNAAQED